MAVNKVVYSGETLVDLTSDTVTPETLAKGVTAHDKSGAIITGTMESGGGGGAENLDVVLAEQEALIAELKQVLTEKAISDIEMSLITREITEYSSPLVTYVGPYAFSGTKITSLHLPALKEIGGYAFYENTTLKSMVFPSLLVVPYNGLRQAKGLATADFHVLTEIGANGFYQCTNLETLIIRTSTLCKLASGSTLTASKILSGTGYIYVPSVLVDSYKVATNWSAVANQFRAIEDYPDICGG